MMVGMVQGRVEHPGKGALWAEVSQKEGGQKGGPPGEE